MEPDAHGGRTARRQIPPTNPASDYDVTLVRLRCSVIVFRGDEVLLVRRTRNGGDWVLPGGCPNPGEGMAACARREVLEEAGLRADISRVAFALETIDPGGSERTIEIVFLAAEAPAPAATEPGLEPAFIRLDDLPGLDLRPPIAGHVRGLRDRNPTLGGFDVGVGGCRRVRPTAGQAGAHHALATIA